MERYRTETKREGETTRDRKNGQAIRLREENGQLWRVLEEEEGVDKKKLPSKTFDLSNK